MGKKPVLRWVGTFWFGLALAGSGCETSSNNAKRTFNPTPTISRNTGTPTAPGGSTTTSTAATNTGAGTGTTANGGFVTQQKSTDIQTISATDSLNARPVPPAPPATDQRIQQSVRETSNRVTDTAMDPMATSSGTRTSTSDDLAPKTASPYARLDNLQITNPRSDTSPPVLPPPPATRGISVQDNREPVPPVPPAPGSSSGIALPPVGTGPDFPPTGK